MCGVAGVVGTVLGDEAAHLVTSVVAAQHDRGPDYSATELVASDTPTAYFGHNRLSIVDLSDSGRQPMWDVDHVACVTFNGEIYNHVELRDELTRLGQRFKSRSDTEVILEAYKRWGLAALDRFNGMFAFALYDARAQEVLLTRDRFGVKPLFFHRAPHSLAFASTSAELAKRLRLPVDLAYLARNLKFGLANDGMATPFVGLRAVAPGTVVRVRAEGGTLVVGTERYYDLTHRVRLARERLEGCEDAQLEEEAEALLGDAVRLRFRADVPAAVSMSGGLDSTLLASLLSGPDREASQAFCFGSPQLSKTEGPLAKEAMDLIRIRSAFTDPPGADGIASAFHATLVAQQEPFSGLSVVAQFLLYRDVARAGFRVVLGGQGGDELFMGYRKFQIFEVQQLVRERRLGTLVSALPSLLRLAVAEIPRARGYLSERRRYGDQGRQAEALRLPEVADLGPGLRENESLGDRQVRDVLTLSLPVLLRYEDRNSMAHSLESRMPFLDYRVAEFGLGLPDRLKVRGGYGKWILRQIARQRIPDSIRTARYKRGFDVAEGDWIRMGLGDAIRRSLCRAAPPLTGSLINPAVDLDHFFSDRALVNRPGAMLEATSLLWLTQRVREGSDLAEDSKAYL